MQISTLIRISKRLQLAVAFEAMSFNEAEAMIALNLREARERISLSQTDLAKRMSALGFRWHQATVYKVENGDRPVKLGEALALSEMLEIPLRDLTAPPEKFQAERRTKDVVLQLVSDMDSIMRAAADYYTNAPRLREWLAQNRDSISEDVREKAEQALSINLADLLDVGRQRAEQRADFIKNRPTPRDISREEQVLDYNLPSLLRSVSNGEAKP